MLRLTIQSGEQRGQVFEAESGPLSIGRSPINRLVLPDKHLSGEHVHIIGEKGRFHIRDNRSTNGSRLRRGEVTISLTDPESQGVLLEDGDLVFLGDPNGPVQILVSITAAPEAKLSKEEQGKIVSIRSLGELSKLEVSLERDPARLSVLFRATRQLAKVDELSEIIQAVANAVFELLPSATHLTVALSDENEPKRIVPVLTQRRDKSEPGEAIPISRTVIQRVMKDRAALQIADAMMEIGSKSIHGAQILSVLGVPLWVSDEVRGVLLVDNRDAPGMFAERDLELLTVLAGQASLCLENTRLVRRLKLAEERLEKENRYLKVTEEKRRFKGIIGQSKTMAKVFEQINKVMDTRVTVAIEGETGTGKELVASMIHYQGNRREKLFVAQNCAALTETLLESELFGHKKGSFTNANEDKKGIFEIADGGTVFLDEVGEMSLSLQSKLLRVLQEGEVRPIGASFAKKIDVRILSATNRNLEEEVAQGRFRKDLFYRLRVFPISLPPLRERKEDIALLTNFFLKKYGEEMSRPMAGFSQEALNLLTAYQWPGNVRELENEMQRIVIQGEIGGFVTPEILSPRIRQAESIAEKLSSLQIEGRTLKDIMDSLEKAVLLEALQEHKNNKTQTAASIGITREGLHKKLSKFGIS
jgi:transcriptional regulator with GAF, ATPase, and Fis domain